MTKSETKNEARLESRPGENSRKRRRKRHPGGAGRLEVDSFERTGKPEQD